MPTECSDRELISACTTGEAWAWNALVDRYQRLVYSIPLRVGLAPEDAEDVFQSVFTLLVEHLHSLRDPQGLAKWLITTTKRESWNLSRKRVREPADSEMVTSVAESAQLSGEIQEETLLSDQVLIRAAFEQLGDRCRELLRLLYYDQEEPSYEEIGRRLGMPLGSIGPNRARCLQKVRSILEAMGMS